MMRCMTTDDRARQAQESHSGPPTLTSLTVRVSDAQAVSAILLVPPNPVGPATCSPMARVGMTHQFMAAVAHGMAERRVATMRFQFPF